MLTPDAKRLLAETIRGTAQTPEKGLRERLLRAIHDEADRRYRLSVPIAEAGLDEAHSRGRERIEAWLDERARATKPKNKTELNSAMARLLAQAEKEAAATLVNRLVLLRHLEALALSKPAVLTGGWNSKGYREFREFAPTLCTNGTTDATEGYATLLQLLFDELALELPGLFGDVGLTRLFHIPAATLREVVERLDDTALSSAWTDDTTLGWVYQYWNDPDREALDAKINDGGKIEPHEIASKTQMFTERYMVEWLLQNSLGLTWLALCKKHGWTAQAESVLPVLEARRAEWRTQREAGEVALDALLPITGELEEHWKYYVPQPIPPDAVEQAPEAVRAIKILDPACGSGHFLVIAFGLLVALYREEAHHLGKAISDQEISESILEHNLHGIDIDPRAIQIAAAGLYLKAKALSKTARPKKLNLVAPVLQLGNLPADDPAVLLLRKDLKDQAGIPEELTTKLLAALAGVDYLGSLLKVDAAVDDAIKNVELSFERTHGQGDLFGGFPAQQVKLSLGEAKATILDKLERFLAKHSKSEDLGLRLDGEQIAAGVRFVRMAREGSYDLVVGNPPYQGLSKTASFGYVAQHYPRGKADLYAAFLERGLELARVGGISALLTMRGWMFLGQFAELRKHLLKANDLRALGDFDRGAFDEVPNEVLAVCVPVFRRGLHPEVVSVATQPTPLDDKSYDRQRTSRKRAALLAQVGRHEFDPRGLAVIEGEPIVYWWSKEFLSKYAEAPKLGNAAPVRQGAATSDNARFLRRQFEVTDGLSSDWAPYIKGGAGRAWIEPLTDTIRWAMAGLEVRAYAQHLYGSYTRTIKNESFYFRRGVAFTPIGSGFEARVHKYASVFGHMGSSAFPATDHGLASLVTLMNSATSKFVLGSLNPGVHFEVGDVNRLPMSPVESAEEIYEVVELAFSEHESHREASVEFKCPGRSPWQYAQQWAQIAVDRPEGAALPDYQPAFEEPSSEALVSFAFGIALG
ncbi:MAG: BREX-6 system adenine-specific DNA-methyltransferase PglX, partial [Polyangiaceae bacterium]